MGEPSAKDWERLGDMSLSRKVYVPLPLCSNENEFRDGVLEELDPWFKSEREVVGRHCSGRRLRIDAVLTPRDHSRWKDETLAFGVEFKLDPAAAGDTRNFTAWAGQAVDYTHVDWNGHGRLMIFTCPSPVTWFEATERGDGISASFLMSRLLWQLGVGELALLAKDGWTLLGQGSHVLWSQARGVHEARRWSLKPTFGHR